MRRTRRAMQAELYSETESLSIVYFRILFYFSKSLSAFHLAFACQPKLPMQRLRLGMDQEDGGSPAAEERLRQNLLDIIEFRRMRQAELAAKLGKSQSWVSKRLSGKPSHKGGARFQFSDLDKLASVFGLSPSELLQPGYGKRDRRKGVERRCGTDRRSRRAFATQPLALPPLRDQAGG